ncbi:solute carrier family 25 member 38 [Gymnopilus junonius]|uniref:Mitochondrial glycine transporter n=1 Tax=Gymnopilus junonius TaxID=109634 RepID=A0A9P5NRT0_GYMJU|nr:solute carrier family 25 member 38 [Gymnopilus junonius]
MSNVGQQLLSGVFNYSLYIFFFHVRLGALSGLSTTICLQPFDLIKTRVQQGDGSMILQHPRSSVIVNIAYEVIGQQGVRGLWRGTLPSLLRNVPGVAMYMTSLTQLRTLMARSPYFALAKEQSSKVNESVLPSLSSTGNLLAGATTRVAVGFLLNPFSVIKARFESNMYNYPSLSQALLSITRQGPSELFRGFLASSLRDAPYAGLFVVFYEGTKREIAYLFPATSSSHAALIHSMSAASAGAVATLATHPFDVIKTKVQIRTEDRYNGFLRTIGTIWIRRGLRGFFDGASLRLSRKVLSSAIGWVVYESLLMFMHQRWSPLI